MATIQRENSVTTFNELNLHPSLLKALEGLNFYQTTEVQTQTIPKVLEGKDIMVSAKTGSGKTAAFCLPMLHKFLQTPKPLSSTRALILLPTRELAIQTQKAFEKFAAFTQIKAGLVMGGEAYKHQVATLRRNPEIIIATPGRLVEHLRNGTADFSDLEFLVLDESDRMLDMGFQENMDAVVAKCSPKRQTLLFSATLKHKGIGGIDGFLTDPERIQVDGAKQGHSNIVQQRVLADDDRHKEELMVQIIEEEDAKRVLVFCRTRKQCQKVSNMLRAHKLVSEYIHGEVGQSDRKQVMNRFLDGKIRVLVATDVAARGLDIKNIDLVVNHSIAFTGDEHVHRVGRTGRADQTGLAVTLVTERDWNAMSSIERYLKIRLQPRRVKGLEAKYTGPKKLKSSGKAAGSKKKKLASKNTANRKAQTKKPKAGPRPSRPKANSASGSDNDGFSPMKRKT